MTTLRVQNSIDEQQAIRLVQNRAKPYTLFHGGVVK